jgi:hypothetical protein
VFVGVDGPCVMITCGARTPGSKVVYPANELAERYGAHAEETTEVPAEAYARFPDSAPRPYAEGDLPDW